MDETRFDDLTRRLGGATTRRAGLKAALGGLLGVAALSALEGSAKEGNHRKKRAARCSPTRPCPEGQVCQGEGTRDARCTCPGGAQACGAACCPTGQHCANGACVSGPAVCPSGQALVNKACACTRDLCGGACCRGNETCRDGACVVTGLRSCDPARIVDGGDYSYCNFRGKTIKASVLRNANFQGADLVDAKLTNRFQPWECSFEDASLIRADLHECDLERGTSFRRADLGSARLADGRIGQVDFRDAKLWKVDLRHTRIDGANFDGAYLGAAKLERLRTANTGFRGANLEAADFDEVNLTKNTDFSGATLTGAVVKDSHVTGVVFAGAKLDKTVFQGCFLKEVDFSGANLTKAEFLFYATRSLYFAVVEGECRLCRFDRADLSEAQWRFSSCTDCSMVGASFTKAEIRGVKFYSCDFSDADLSVASIGASAPLYSDTPLPTQFIYCALDRSRLDPAEIRNFHDTSAFGQDPTRMGFRSSSLRDAVLGPQMREVANRLWFRSTDLTGATGSVPDPAACQHWCWNLLPDGTRSSRDGCDCPAGTDRCWPWSHLNDAG